ncbi:32401_t:CDS:2, partial [Racocetra persica]
VSCYAAAGLVAGTATGGLGAPAAALLCNVAQETCMAACAASFLTPIP